MATYQLSLFAWRPVDDIVSMGHLYQCQRTPDQLLRSVIAYCEWRAGASWRNVTLPHHRNDRDRWDYLSAVRLLERVRYTETRPQLVLPALEHDSSPSPSELQLRKQPRKDLAAELVALDPSFTDQRLLARLPRTKLATMVAERRAARRKVRIA